jgi:hypothetical protein
VLYNLVDIRSYLWILDQVRDGKGLSDLNPPPFVEGGLFSVSPKMGRLKLSIRGNRKKPNIILLDKIIQSISIPSSTLNIPFRSN